MLDGSAGQRRTNRLPAVSSNAQSAMGGTWAAASMLADIAVTVYLPPQVICAETLPFPRQNSVRSEEQEWHPI